MIDVAENHWQIILELLNAYVPQYEVWGFGSRFTGKARSYSDMDLVLVGEKAIDILVMASLKEAFEESNLPFRVDVLDWNVLTKEFQKVIMESGFKVLRGALVS